MARRQPERVLADDVCANGIRARRHRLATAVAALTRSATRTASTATNGRTAPASATTVAAAHTADQSTGSDAAGGTAAVAASASGPAARSAARAAERPGHQRAAVPCDVCKCLRPFNPHACLRCLALFLDGFSGYFFDPSNRDRAQLAWSIDDLNGAEHVADHQTASCGLFYASQCAHGNLRSNLTPDTLACHSCMNHTCLFHTTDSDTITSLLDLPPSTPPPPLRPDDRLNKLSVHRVLASGGFQSNSDGVPNDNCTDLGATPCVALGREQPVSHPSHTHTY